MCDWIHEFPLASGYRLSQIEGSLFERRRSQIVQHSHVLFVKDNCVVTFFDPYPAPHGSNPVLDDWLRKHSLAVFPFLLHLLLDLFCRQLTGTIARMYDLGCKTYNCAHANCHSTFRSIQRIL